MSTENGAKAPEQDEDRRPTERVILEKIAAVVIPPDATVEQVEAAVKALATKGVRKPDRGPAWQEVSRQTAPSKKAAIEAYAGKAGTADAKVGEWRAPSVTAWKGGLKHSAPPKPLIEAEAFE